ncbi:MAG: CNNM domain-containing protein, partial [Catalinimonas sp.]
VISGVLTLLILVLSEIIPKTIGANYWKSLVPFTVQTLRIIIWALYPLVWMAQVLTRLLSKKDKEPNISREEISAMADIGQEAGIFEESESRILKNLIRFKSIKAEDIMTPRTVVIAYPDTMTLQEVYEDPQYRKFTRVPIYQQYRDNVLGFIHKHDVLAHLANDEHKKLVTEVVREMLVVRTGTTMPKLFERLLEARDQIALVADEYGGMAGVVTMEDVIETLLGIEIMDEFDSTHDMQAYARERWRRRAEKLGLLEELESQQEEKRDAVQLGLTGGRLPQNVTPPLPSPSDNPKS